MVKQLPKEITSYDLIKTFAVIFMIVDHTGWYFFPDNEWWRALGRLCVPVWFFLIGYARSRDTGPKLWAGTLVLVAANFFVGRPLLPVNILGTMIIVRLTMDSVIKSGLQTPRFWILCALLTLFIIPTGMTFEYGTQAILLAIYGYLIRHRDEEEISAKFINQYLVFSYVGFVVIQGLGFGLDAPQFIVMGAGSLAVMIALSYFRPATFPQLTATVPAIVVQLLQFTGRHTLLIYVVHLLVFKGLAAYLHPHAFVPFTFKLSSFKGL